MLLPNRYFYIAIAVLLLTIIFCGKKIKQKNSLLLLGIIYVVIMFTLLVNVYYRNMEFLFSVIIPFPLFLMYSIKRENIEEFFEAYTNIVFVIACLSLFFFIFGSVLGIVKETGYYPYTTVGWGTNNYHDYYHLYCEGQEVYNVTIGRDIRGKREGFPTFGNRVCIRTNSTIVGNITIGDDVLIAPNTFVNFDVPSHSVVIGNPASIHHKDNATEGHLGRLE